MTTVLEAPHIIKRFDSKGNEKYEFGPMRKVSPIVNLFKELTGVFPGFSGFEGKWVEETRTHVDSEGILTFKVKIFHVSKVLPA